MFGLRRPRGWGTDDEIADCALPSIRSEGTDQTVFGCFPGDTCIRGVCHPTADSVHNNTQYIFNSSSIAELLPQEPDLEYNASSSSSAVPVAVEVPQEAELELEYNASASAALVPVEVGLPPADSTFDRYNESSSVPELDHNASSSAELEAGPADAAESPVVEMAAELVGCFYDNVEDRDLAGAQEASADMDPGLCEALCEGFAFMGLQFGKQCFCGDEPGSYGEAPAEDCSRPCAGDATLVCGGRGVNSVYRLGGRSNDTAAPLGPAPGSNYTQYVSSNTSVVPAEEPALLPEPGQSKYWDEV